MALFEGKLYVCDVGRELIAVFDLRNRTFGYLTKDPRLKKPVNIFIDDNGFKYVADSTAGLVFVFDRDDNLVNMLGQQLKINPVIMRVGLKPSTVIRFQPDAELPPGEISLISDMALDQQGNIYVTDKAGGRITQFNRYGIFRRTIGRPGDNIDDFVRPKGIAIDRDNRIWIVDAATEVAKIYNEQAQLLLFFGLPGNKPGMMNLPAKIVIDYDNVEFFQKYAIQGAKIEFLVLVSNQYGPNKISVYGFGTFPVHGRAKK
jgi:DNA-binding beta-propeller fold protein YncE